MRRGQGTYQKVIRAMDILKEYQLPFGFSTCYHRQNAKVVGSEEYIDLMVEKGCKFGWYFTYSHICISMLMEMWSHVHLSTTLTLILNRLVC